MLTQKGSYHIEYDENGNPTVIGAKTGDLWFYGWRLEWEGRQLVSSVYFDNYMSSADESDWDFYYNSEYTYNADGIRTSKTVDGVTYEYILDGSKILGERWTEGTVEYLMLYIYDQNGAPLGIKYRTSAYAQNVFDCFFFEKNLQGDIIAIYDSTGTKIGSYKYDAWGNFTTVYTSGNTTLERRILGTLNPFHYRGYYYDTGTGFYYLQSRYYNPDWGRFINADVAVSTGQGLLGNNMFSYCLNNPTNGCDPCGTCFHRLDFWNDCENCGGKSFAVKVKETFDEIMTVQRDIRQIAISNINIDAGVSIGAHFAVAAGLLGIDFGARMDIVGMQLKDGKFRIGHIGHSARAITIGDATIGPQWSTYENFSGGIREATDQPSYFDFGPSMGSSAIVVLGSHWNVSFSISGTIIGVIDYAKNRWFSK